VDSRRAPIFAGIAVAALAFVLVFLVVLPKSHQVSDARDQLSDLRNQQELLESQKNALEDTRDRAPEARRTIKEVQEQIPPVADLPGLILLLQNAATSAGLDVVSLSPGTPTLAPSGDISVISVGLSTTGTYFAVTDFMHRIETLPRAAKVTGLSLAPAAAATVGSTPQLTVTGTIELYTSDTSAGPGSNPGPTPGAGG
jgi:Tfp pilus assembly protein PilO